MVADWRDRGRDTSDDGRADILLRFNKKGQIVEQETRSEGAHPDTKIFLTGDSSQEIRRCIDSNGDGQLDLMILQKDGKMSQTLLDLDQDGQADQRDLYDEGRRTRIEIDTNADSRPDVVQRLGTDGQTVSQQDEDTDYDGRIDQRFIADQPTPLKGTPEAPEKLPKLKCGPFDSFWKSH